MLLQTEDKLGQGALCAAAEEVAAVITAMALYATGLGDGENGINVDLHAGPPSHGTLPCDSLTTRPSGGRAVIDDTRARHSHYRHQAADQPRRSRSRRAAPTAADSSLRRSPGLSPLLA